MQNQPFFKEVYSVPEMLGKDIEKAFGKLHFNGICIVANLTPENWSSEIKNTLKKIIQLTGHKYEECLLIDEKNGAALVELVKCKSVTHILLFTDSIAQNNLQFTISPFKWTKINQKSIYQTVNIDSFLDNKHAKGGLWNALQEEFEAARNFKKE